MNTSSGAQSPFDSSQPTADLSVAVTTSQPNDANATQPLPVARTSGSGRLSGAGSVLGGLQSGTAAPVGSNVFDPPDDDAANNVPVQTRPSVSATPTGRLPLLPMPTLIGLAAVGGALIVVLIPALMRRVIQPVPMNSFPSEPVARNPASRVPIAPPIAIQPLPQKPSHVDAGNEVPSTAPPSTSSAPDAIGVAAPDATREFPSTGENSDNSSASLPQSDERERSAVTKGKQPLVPTPNPEQALPSEPDKSMAAENGAAWVHPRTGYAISPPQGFQRRRTGRRTIWRGPGGAQLLVETTTSPGTSARADWERLSGALAKKYGRHYRSLGIRETTLAGRPAALWEFEISSKRGTTRKIDVAVHERGRGYAVLAEAPASRFDAMRPQLEAAIASFQPPARHESGDSSSRSPTRRDEASGGHARDGETADTRREAREEAESFSQPGY